MLVFSQAQCQALAEAAFVRRMHVILGVLSPDSAMHESAGLENGIREQLRRAKERGFTDERDCARWVLCAWCLGEDFDRKIASFATLLDRDDVGPAYKALAMELTLRAVFLALAGQSKNVL
ncbi:hypothetical protein [Noviherbaspirillum sp.]|uniref:hypothetical protein n=1 Tax=Noviherbaspirillum sp. TaxID=1926288 RepID=UPI002FE0561B